MKTEFLSTILALLALTVFGSGLEKSPLDLPDLPVITNPISCYEEGRGKCGEFHQSTTCGSETYDEQPECGSMDQISQFRGLRWAMRIPVLSPGSGGQTGRKDAGKIVCGNRYECSPSFDSSIKKWKCQKGAFEEFIRQEQTTPDGDPCFVNPTGTDVFPDKFYPNEVEIVPAPGR